MLLTNWELKTAKSLKAKNKMELSEIKLLIFGAGRWGINHVKTASAILPHENILVVDPNPDAFEKIYQISDRIGFSTDINSAIANKNYDAAIIATPAETHFKLAKELLLQKKNCLVEKPITLNLEDAIELKKIASEQKLKLMVGHVLLYHPAVKRMKAGIDAGEIGQLQYIYSNRLNLGAIRSEENILWSFAPHDISVILYLTNSFPVKISANGSAIVQPNVEDTTITYLTMENGIHAHIFVSWLNPFKEQRMVVIGEKGMYVFEDSLPSDKLKLYSKGFTNKEGKIEKFDAGFQPIQIDSYQPLKNEQMEFFNSILESREPLSNGEEAIRVLEVLFNCSNSLNKN